MYEISTAPHDASVTAPKALTTDKSVIHKMIGEVKLYVLLLSLVILTKCISTGIQYFGYPKHFYSCPGRQSGCEQRQEKCIFSNFSSQDSSSHYSSSSASSADTCSYLPGNVQLGETWKPSCSHAHIIITKYFVMHKKAVGSFSSVSVVMVSWVHQF